MTGGNCPGNESIQREMLSNSEVSHHHTFLLSRFDIHSGANYSVRMKGMSYLANDTSNFSFSEPENFTTPEKGVYIHNL